MIKKLLDIYKIYFFISLLVSVILVVANIPSPYYVYILIVIGAFLTPFLYELDFLLYAFILDPSNEVSKNIRSLLKQKNYGGTFLYAHENSQSLENDVLRSIFMVIGVYAIGFMLLFGYSNYLAISIVLTYLLTSLYLQSLSFGNNSWRAWYSFLDFVPKENVAKAFLAVQYVVFVIFILKVF